MYFNWQGAVKVPAVMQYAKKQSQLVGEHIKDHLNLVNFINYVKQQLSIQGPGAESEEMLKKLIA